MSDSDGSTFATVAMIPLYLLGMTLHAIAFLAAAEAWGVVPAALCGVPVVGTLAGGIAAYQLGWMSYLVVLILMVVNFVVMIGGACLCETISDWRHGSAES